MFFQILKYKKNDQVSKPQVDANDWIEHFSTLFESEDTNIYPLGKEEHCYALPVTTMFSNYLNAEFTELEIHEEILETPNKKVLARTVSHMMLSKALHTQLTSTEETLY